MTQCSQKSHGERRGSKIWQKSVTYYLNCTYVPQIFLKLQEGCTVTHIVPLLNHVKLMILTGLNECHVWMYQINHPE